MQSISVHDLNNMLNAKDEIQLIDVREEDEHLVFNIGGLLLPLGIIQNHLDKIRTDIPVVFYCRKGVRSMIAIQKLEQKYPFGNLLNLSGGMDEWIDVFGK